MTTTNDPVARSRAYYAYLDQGELWIPKDKAPVRIADMDPAWRYNAAAFMVRNAETYEFNYSLGELTSFWGGPFAPSPDTVAHDEMDLACEQAQTERMNDPEAWIKTTSLYRALVKNLPENAAELAKHWSGCVLRTAGGACTCSPQEDVSPEGSL